MVQVGRASRGFLLAALGTVSGCSFLFQDTLPNNYKGATEPECSDSVGWPVVDTIFASSAVVGVLTIPGTLTEEDRTVAVAGNVGDLLLFGASAAIGYAHASSCSRAQREWEESPGGISDRADRDRARAVKAAGDNPHGDPTLASSFWCGAHGACWTEEAECGPSCHETTDAWCAISDSKNFTCASTRTRCLEATNESREDFGECVERRAGRPTKRNAVVAVPAVPATTVAPPRGHYCSTSSSINAAGFCAREKADCGRSRDAAMGVVGDLSECSLVEAAQCFTINSEPRCYPSAESCAAAHARPASSGAIAISTCTSTN